MQPVTDTSESTTIASGASTSAPLFAAFNPLNGLHSYQPGGCDYFGCITTPIQNLSGELIEKLTD